MKPEMTATAAAELIKLSEKNGITVWLDGGWAVDALLGEQTRPHKDLDTILSIDDFPKLVELLEDRGFMTQPGGTPSNPVMADNSGLEVDIHVFTFNDDGSADYPMESGEIWVFPAEAFSGRGAIGDVNVRCLSAEEQVRCHSQGYTPTEKDFQDMELLEVRFGVQLPPQLRREKS